MILGWHDEDVNGYDVIVLGLGGMGSAAARHLSARGARVLGLERFTPAHALGASHGDSRIVRMAYFEKPDYVPLLRRAYQLWDELGADLGHEVFVRTGALMIGAADTAVVAGTLASVRQWELPHEVLDEAAMSARYPQFALMPGEMAVYETGAGYVNPEEVVRAHLNLAERDGAELRFQALVTGWRAGPAGVVVTVGEEEIRADKLVIAAGAWTPTLVPQLDVPMRVGRRVMHYMEPVSSAEDFAADRFPVYIFQTGPGDEIYGFPVIGSPSTGVKVGFHHRGPDVDPDEIDRVVSDLEEDEMRELLAERIPGIAGRHVQSKVCMYTLTPDEDFVIDQLPNSYGRVCVAAGFSGHGFKFTPVVGEILADLALTGETSYPIEFLAADRF
ncbi:MAG: glycine/D-amino acid oxidase, deaminating [Pseudonocardiales bacterium]|nr:glycine/D-amino acid oxidase, deaminating [Pseudonocardiales bacterium]